MIRWGREDMIHWGRGDKIQLDRGDTIQWGQGDTIQWVRGDKALALLGVVVPFQNLHNTEDSLIKASVKTSTKHKDLYYIHNV